MSALKLYFGKLRGKFLLIFALGMVATMAVVAIFNYRATYDVFDVLNGDIVEAEFKHISDGVGSLVSTIERVMEAELLSDENIMWLTRYDGEGHIEYINAVNRLKEAVSRVSASFPYIESVYFFINGERIVATSRTSTREIYRDDDAWPPESVMEAFRGARHSLAAVGGVFTDEMCLYTADSTMRAPLVTLYRSLYIRGKSVVYAVNIYEDQFCSLYSGLVTAGERVIRFLTEDGVIISSPYKAELGERYELPAGDSLAESGEAVVGGREKHQVNWARAGTANMVILSETGMRAYIGLFSSLQTRVAALFIAGICVTCFLFFRWLNRILAPLDKLIEGMRRAGNGDHAGKLPQNGTDEFSLLARHYNRMLDDLEASALRQRGIEAEIRESELRALRNQINPHFLYNTLNVIRWMARFSGADNIEQCVRALGALIAPLYKDDSPSCALRQEIELLDQYLIIMNFRYNGGISFRFDIPEALLGAEIPRFILQPLVENSIKHGFAASGQCGSITLSAAESDGMLTLTVADDGVGMSDADISAFNSAMALDSGALAPDGGDAGIGMRNVNRRVRLRYGSSYGVSLRRRAPAGLECVVALPLLSAM